MTTPDTQGYTKASVAHANDQSVHDWQTTKSFVERRCSWLQGRSADMKCSSRAVHRARTMQRSPTQREPRPIGSGSRAHLRQPAASQLVHDGQVGCWASSLRKHVGKDGHNRALRAGTRQRCRCREKVSSGQVCGDIRAETITKDTSDQLTRRKSR